MTDLGRSYDDWTGTEQHLKLRSPFWLRRPEIEGGSVIDNRHGCLLRLRTPAIEGFRMGFVGVGLQAVMLRRLFVALMLS